MTIGTDKAVEAMSDVREDIIRYDRNTYRFNTFSLLGLVAHGTNVQN